LNTGEIIAFASHRGELAQSWQRAGIQGEEMADPKVTIEQLPSGKWACFLHLPGQETPAYLGKEFKNEEQAENWLNVSEAVTAIEMMTRKAAAAAK
jgi:hypothetical protein